MELNQTLEYLCAQTRADTPTTNFIRQIIASRKYFFAARKIIYRLAKIFFRRAKILRKGKKIVKRSQIFEIAKKKRKETKKIAVFLMRKYGENRKRKFANL